MCAYVCVFACARMFVCLFACARMFVCLSAQLYLDAYEVVRDLGKDKPSDDVGFLTR